MNVHGLDVNGHKEGKGVQGSGLKGIKLEQIRIGMRIRIVVAMITGVGVRIPI